MRRTIIITGATSGIGNALAKWLAKYGHLVIAVGRNEKALEELTRLYPANIKAIICDLTKDEDRTKITNSLPADLDGVYLVSNAGIAVPGLLANLTEEEWDRHYLINTKAPVFLTKLLLPHLKNGGRVLNISTGLAHSSLPGFSAYGLSKAALYMMKEFCNTELHDQNITFGSAMPGIVDTPIQEHIRSTSIAEFPAVGLFKGFKQRDELLAPVTVAKFLAWLLLETDKKEFSNGEWDIYNMSHHQYWAEIGEIKPRHNQNADNAKSALK